MSKKKLSGIKLAVAMPNAPDMIMEISRQQIIDWFQYVYLISYAGQNTISWCGWHMQKNPMDMWMYQEIITYCQPDVIIETGTSYGGSALFMAMLCDAIGNGQVISIDIRKIKDQPPHPKHPRIEYLVGDSVSEKILNIVQQRCAGKLAMVILDSDHTMKHVTNELNSYARFVSVGQYLIVEDTQINGHPVGQNWGAGPWEAVEEWLPKHPEFMQDKECERFLLTWNPNGYLKRKESKG